MKPFVFLATLAAILSSILPIAQAAPDETRKVQAQSVVMCKNKDIRLLLLHELTCTPERQLKTIKKLKEAPEFREMYDHNLDRS